MCFAIVFFIFLVLEFCWALWMCKLIVFNQIRKTFHHFSSYFFFLRFLHSGSNYTFVGLFEVVLSHWCSVQIFFIFSPCVLFIYILLNLSIIWFIVLYSISLYIQHSHSVFLQVILHLQLILALFPCCTLYPCNFFILYRVVCTSLSPLPILPLLLPLFPRTPW